ncbi:TetR/AcrR family transcriptional regulator [Agromyces albus]|uniref:TetR/AcrR family transcriptional regulator n=1 Tax=Agromyces albus TaxID=205332 RepID=UPI002782F75A|nr:TetR/AcrR family transcriptional regulator [Agromyces albus]MDQ0577599.1 AcrR family transcriptional regulator [Agromyces albus]
MSIEKRKYELKSRAASQQQTRERIVAATVELHTEVGPALTTVAEVARRAGVQRLTVYNHFPEDAGLFGACQAHWMQQHPLPDVATALTADDPAERVRSVFRAQYGWYRETEPMAEKVQRDRGAVPALDSLMRRTADARLDQLADTLATGLGESAERRALIRLGLDFWTWRRLTREGLDDDRAAELMTAAATAWLQRS